MSLVDHRRMGRKPLHLANATGPHPFAFLAQWRETAGLTQGRVADTFAVSDVTIHRWETGKAPITVRDFVLLARLYKAESPGYLLFPPDHPLEAALWRDVTEIVVGMNEEDLQRWLDVGRSLAAKRQPAGDEEKLPEP